MNGMSATLSTRTGIEIHLHQARLERVSIIKEGATQLPEPAAALAVPFDLLAAVKLHGGTPVMVTLMRHERTAAGVILVRGIKTLAALMFDVAAPALDAWLAVASEKGYLPVVLRDRATAKVIHAMVGPDIATTIRQRESLRTMTQADLVDAASTVLRTFDDDAALQRVGLEPGAVREATLALLLPPEVGSGSGAATAATSYH